jgi:hypothetical protein
MNDSFNLGSQECDDFLHLMGTEAVHLAEGAEFRQCQGDPVRICGDPVADYARSTSASTVSPYADFVALKERELQLCGLEEMFDDAYRLWYSNPCFCDRCTVFDVLFWGTCGCFPQTRRLPQARLSVDNSNPSNSPMHAQYVCLGMTRSFINVLRQCVRLQPNLRVELVRTLHAPRGQITSVLTRRLGRLVLGLDAVDVLLQHDPAFSNGPDQQVLQDRLATRLAEDAFSTPRGFEHMQHCLVFELSVRAPGVLSAPPTLPEEKVDDVPQVESLTDVLAELGLDENRVRQELGERVDTGLLHPSCDFTENSTRSSQIKPCTQPLGASTSGIYTVTAGAIRLIHCPDEVRKADPRLRQQLSLIIHPFEPLLYLGPGEEFHCQLVATAQTGASRSAAASAHVFMRPVFDPFLAAEEFFIRHDPEFKNNQAQAFRKQMDDPQDRKVNASQFAAVDICEKLVAVCRAKVFVLVQSEPVVAFAQVAPLGPVGGNVKAKRRALLVTYDAADFLPREESEGEGLREPRSTSYDTFLVRSTRCTSCGACGQDQMAQATNGAQVLDIESICGRPVASLLNGGLSMLSRVASAPMSELHRIRQDVPIC